jgi:hypothetical protein
LRVTLSTVKVTPKLPSIALWPSSFTRRGDLQVEITRVLYCQFLARNTSLSRPSKMLLEPCLYVFVCLLRIEYNPLHHVSMSLAYAQRVVQHNTGEE